MNTLLEKAKSATVQRINHLDISHEHVELAIAWLKGEISMPQAGIALGLKRAGSNANTSYKLATYLREGVRMGTVEVKYLPPERRKEK